MPLDDHASTFCPLSAKGLDLRFNVSPVTPDSQATRYEGDDCGLAVLATAPRANYDALAHAILPTYGGRLKWSLCATEDLPRADYYDLTIAASTGREDLAVASQMTQGGRGLVIFLVPQNAVTERDRVNAGLVVPTEGPDALASLPLLAHTLIAPFSIEGMVCIDWADFLTVLEDGDQAVLLTGAGATASAAIDQLSGALARHAARALRGACGTMLSRDAVMRDYHRFSKVIARHTRSEDFMAVTVRHHQGLGTLACVLAITERKVRAR